MSSDMTRIFRLTVALITLTSGAVSAQDEPRAYAGALIGTCAYLIGFIASFWLPEPPRADIAD